MKDFLAMAYIPRPDQIKGRGNTEEQANKIFNKFPNVKITYKEFGYFEFGDAPYQNLLIAGTYEDINDLVKITFEFSEDGYDDGLASIDWIAAGDNLLPNIQYELKSDYSKISALDLTDPEYNKFIEAVRVANLKSVDTLDELISASAAEKKRQDDEWDAFVKKCKAEREAEAARRKAIEAAREAAIAEAERQGLDIDDIDFTDALIKDYLDF